MQHVSVPQPFPAALHALQIWLAQIPLQHSENAWHFVPPGLQVPPELLDEVVVPVLDEVVVPVLVEVVVPVLVEVVAPGPVLVDVACVPVVEVLVAPPMPTEVVARPAPTPAPPAPLLMDEPHAPALTVITASNTIHPHASSLFFMDTSDRAWRMPKWHPLR